MAYSNYGGYAYRNGVRVLERSDCVLSPDEIISTPGIWPGWVRPEGMHYPCLHVLLGDGPIFLGMRKTSISVYRLCDELDPVALREDSDDDGWFEYARDGEVPKRYIDTDHYDDDHPLVMHVDGARIEVRWLWESNFFCYACLTQPDGVSWCGFSGYGVGAGFEHAWYDSSTPERVDQLRDKFPDAMRPQHDMEPAQ